MELRARIKVGVSFALVVAGVFLLAYSTVIDVFEDPKRVELTGSVDNGDSNLAAVLFSALLIAWGSYLGLTAVTRAEGRARRLAWLVGGTSMFILVFLHSRLFINSLTVSPERESATVIFSAGYFMHSGAFYSFPVMYVIFLVTVVLLAGAVGGAAYLLAPQRFSEAFGRKAGWQATEGLVVTLSLFVALSLVVFLTSVVELALNADVAQAQQEEVTGGGDPSTDGFLRSNVVALHYLMAFLLGGLVATIGARVFLVNWGVHGPSSRGRVLDALNGVGRVERTLLGSVIVMDLVLLVAPPIVPRSYLSEDLVFRLTSRSLYAFFLLVLVPYAFYARGLRRLGRLMAAGAGPPRWQSPFSNASMRLVLVHLAGILLITTVYAAVGSVGEGDVLGFMLLFTTYTAVVLLANSTRFTVEAGVPHPSLRGGRSAAPFFGFVVFALAAALMLWGAGNTFQATYHAETNTMTVVNESVWGADILSRLAAAVLAGGVLVLSLMVLMDAAKVRRPAIASHVTIIVSVAVAMMVAFSVGVWSSGLTEGTVDAFTGFAFHQYGALEATLVGVVLVLAVGTLYWAVGRILVWTSARWALSRNRAVASWGDEPS